MDQKEYPDTTESGSDSGKVSDSFAIYGMTQSHARPHLRQIRIADVEIPKEAMRFVEAHQLQPHLETSIHLAAPHFLMQKIFLLPLSLILRFPPWMVLAFMSKYLKA